MLCFIIFKKITDAFESLSVNTFPSYGYSLQFLHGQLSVLLLSDFLEPGQNWFRKLIVANII